LFFLILSPLSGVCGELWSEDIVKASILQDDLYSSFHVEPLLTQPGVAATVNPPKSGSSPTHSSTCVPVQDLNDALRQTLHSPNIKILIKRCSGCTKPSAVTCTLSDGVSKNSNNEGPDDRAGSSIFLILFLFFVVVVFMTH
jgi:hypothetical protein